MTYKVVLIIHLLGAAVWTGGHLVLSLSVLPKVLKTKDLSILTSFESRFELVGIPSLLLQVITGIYLAWHYVPDAGAWFSFSGGITTIIGIKLSLLILSLLLAVHARLFLIPKLTSENLRFLAVHILAVTTIAVIMLMAGATVRWGGV